MASIMAAIDEESFDDGKIIVAKQATSKKCLTVDQIKQILMNLVLVKTSLRLQNMHTKDAIILMIITK